MFGWKSHTICPKSQKVGRGGSVSGPLPCVVCKAGFCQVEEPGVGPSTFAATQRLFGHGLMATWIVRASGLWDCVPISALINIYQRFIKKQRKGHPICQGQETPESYKCPCGRVGSGEMEQGDIYPVLKIIGQHGRRLAGAVVYVGKNRAGAFVITTPVCAALVRHFHDLFTPLHRLGGGNGETEAGSISSNYPLMVEL